MFISELKRCVRDVNHPESLYSIKAIRDSDVPPETLIKCVLC